MFKFHIFKSSKHLKQCFQIFIFSISSSYIFTYFIYFVYCVCNLTRTAQKNLIQCVSINIQLVVLLPDTKAAESRNVVQQVEHGSCCSSFWATLVLELLQRTINPGVNKRGRLPSVWRCLAHEYVS